MAGFDEIENEDFGRPKPENFNPIEEIQPSVLGNPRPFTPTEDLAVTNITVKERPLNRIIRQIRGYPWKVSYYNNIASSNDLTETLSTKLDVSSQKYRLMSGLTIWLESALDQSSQEIKSLEFTAIINSGFIPFKKDYIEVNLMSDRKALFEVNNVENMTYMQHDVYKVTAKFYNYVDLLKDEYKSLNNKVVNKLVEDKDYIMDYGSPMLLEEDYKVKQDLKKHRADLIKFFYDKFLDKDTKYLSITATPYDVDELVSDHGYKIIDEYLNDYIRSLVSTDDDSRIVHVRKPSYITFNMRCRTILDCILEQDETYLYTAEKELSFKRPVLGLEPTEEQSVVVMSVEEVVDKIRGAYGTRALQIYRRPQVVLDIDYPLSLDINSRTYIFSKKFYSEEREGLTTFEKIVSRFIKKETVNHLELLPFIKSIRYWSKFEQFYVIPIIINIITHMTKNTFSAK